MARTKATVAQSRSQAETRAVLAEALPISLDMPDPHELASPCPTPSRKRKRSQCHAETSSPAQVDEASDEQSTTGAKSCNAYHHRKSRTSRRNVTSWKFKVGLCDCLHTRSIRTNILPRSLAEDWTRIEEEMYEMTSIHPSNGVFADGEGSELWRVSELWDDYMASGLPGIVWHQDFEACRDRAEHAEARRRRHNVVARGCSSLAEASATRDEYDEEEDYGSAFGEQLESERGTIEQTTPAPLPVVLKELDQTSSTQRTPWTIMTSSSTGQITQLQNSESRSSIKRQALLNVFDEDEILLWEKRGGCAILDDATSVNSTC